MQLLFSNDIQTTSTGRNGSIKTTGVFISVNNWGNEVRHVLSLAPRTSRGDLGRCDIDVPMTDVPELILALETMLASYHHSQELKTLV